jgi:hypothetical protein
VAKQFFDVYYIMGSVVLHRALALIQGAVTERRAYWVTINGDEPVGPVQYLIEAERIYVL